MKNNKLEKNLENFKVNQVFYNLYKGIDSNIRKAQGLTIEDLANKSYGLLTERTIHNYETGKTDPSASNILLMATLLGASTDALFKRDLTYSYTNFNKVISKEVFYPKKGFKEVESIHNYDFSENLGDSNRLYYLVLENDSVLLRLPKGAKVIIDKNGDFKKDLIPDKMYYGIFKTKDLSNIYVSPLNYSPTPRKKDNYIYYDIDNNLKQGTLDDIETLCYGLVKKAVIDF